MTPVIRFAVVFLLASGTTVSLFRVMNMFVAMGDLSLDDTGRNQRIEFTRIKQDSRAERRQRELPTRVQPKTPPETPPMERADNAGSSAVAVAVSAPAIEADLDLGELSLGAGPSNAEEVPVVRVEPMYPVAAASKGIEGWVSLEFDITETGATSNITVVDAHPRRVFEESAIRAVRKWKYRPKVIDGQAQRTRGVTVRLVFTLD